MTKYTPELMAEVAKLELKMSTRAACQKLGVSHGTIYKLRRQARENVPPAQRP